MKKCIYVTSWILTFRPNINYETFVCMSYLYHKELFPLVQRAAVTLSFSDYEVNKRKMEKFLSEQTLSLRRSQLYCCILLLYLEWNKLVKSSFICICSRKTQNTSCFSNHHDCEIILSYNKLFCSLNHNSI